MPLFNSKVQRCTLALKAIPQGMCYNIDNLK
jgi:hypothetical protein